MAETSRKHCPPDCKYKRCTGRLIKPLTPEILADALQDKAHLDIGVGRSAQGIRSIGKEGKE